MNAGCFGGPPKATAGSTRPSEWGGVWVLLLQTQYGKFDGWVGLKQYPWWRCTSTAQLTHRIGKTDIPQILEMPYVMDCHEKYDVTHTHTHKTN